MQHLEFEEQKKIFEWARLNENKFKCLKYLNSSQNGLKISNLKTAVRAKQAGMKAGFPDIFLPYPTQLYAGLFIELKRPLCRGKAKPKIAQAQLEWMEYLNNVGYKAIICYGASEAIQAICDYLS